MAPLKPSSTERKAESLTAWFYSFLMAALNGVFMLYRCNVPFCESTRDYKHSICPAHRWENTKFNVKKYREILPVWALKRCKKHGLLTKDEVYKNPSHKNFFCWYCVVKCRKPHDSIKRKEYYKINSTRMKNRDLKKKYGLGLQEYNLMLLNQNNSCAICKIDKDTLVKKYFHVDHCHITKKIRGLLCFKCNASIGLMDESIDRMKSA